MDVYRSSLSSDVVMIYLLRIYPYALLYHIISQTEIFLNLFTVKNTIVMNYIL